MRKIVIGILVVLVAGCSYKLKFVNVQSEPPNNVLSEKLEQDSNYYVVAHYYNDRTNYHFRLTNIEFASDDAIIATPSKYDLNSQESKFFNEANKKLKEGKNSVERPARPSQKQIANQVHLYLYESDSNLVGSQIKIANSEIDVIRDLSFNNRPPRYLLYIILGAAGGIALLFWGIWYAFFKPIGDASKEGCYVATMVYGSYDAPEVIVLRKFRDNWLMNYRLGRYFIKWYYNNSPGFVQRHQNKPRIRRIIKFGLDLFVRTISKKYL